MSNIPLARELLKEVADDAPPHIAERIIEISDAHLHREKYVAERGEVSSDPFTPELRDKVLDHSAKHPELNGNQLATHFNISQGRVTEARAYAKSLRQEAYSI